jgi:Transposase DDE domain
LQRLDVDAFDDLAGTSVAAGLAFPHAAQAIQITRRRTVKGKWSRETCYAVTSLTVTQASYAQLAAIIRGHWGIEDRLHWVRDTGFGEDRSQVRTASGPRIMASLQPGHHHPAPGRNHQHRRRFALPRPAAHAPSRRS